MEELEVLAVTDPDTHALLGYVYSFRGQCVFYSRDPYWWERLLAWVTWRYMRVWLWWRGVL